MINIDEIILEHESETLIAISNMLIKESTYYMEASNDIDNIPYDYTDPKVLDVKGVNFIKRFIDWLSRLVNIIKVKVRKKIVKKITTYMRKEIASTEGGVYRMNHVFYEIIERTYNRIIVKNIFKDIKNFDESINYGTKTREAIRNTDSLDSVIDEINQRSKANSNKEISKNNAMDWVNKLERCIDSLYLFIESTEKIIKENKEKMKETKPTNIDYFNRKNFQQYVRFITEISKYFLKLTSKIIELSTEVISNGGGTAMHSIIIDKRNTDWKMGDKEIREEIKKISNKFVNLHSPDEKDRDKKYELHVYMFFNDSNDTGQGTKAIASLGELNGMNTMEYIRKNYPDRTCCINALLLVINDGGKWNPMRGFSQIIISKTPSDQSIDSFNWTGNLSSNKVAVFKFDDDKNRFDTSNLIGNEDENGNFIGYRSNKKR